MIRFSLTRANLPRALNWIVGETADSIADRFREWTRQVERYLTSVPFVDVREIVIDGSDTNVDVAIDFKPAAVLLGGILLMNTPATAIASATSLDWIAVDGGYRVRSIQGLTSGTKYQVTLVALGEAA